MTDRNERTGKGAQGTESSSDDGEERPTVAPPFDPVAFAQEVLGTTPSPPKGTPAAAKNPAPPPAKPAPAKQTPFGGIRAPSPTVSDAGEGEETAPTIARVGPVGRPTPSGLMSLANSRVPSQMPPKPVTPAPMGGDEPPTARKESLSSLGAVDREWVELATRPPPPNFDGREGGTTKKGKPTTAPPPAEVDDEAATRPPPPMQQELIDAMARGDQPPSTKQAADLTSALAQAALRSVPVPAPVTPAAPTAQEMNDRIALGDYSGALEIAEKLLELDPNDSAAKSCAENCRTVLKQMYTARIGPLDRVPMVMVARDQLRWLSIDHRAGFVLSLVDGVSSLEMILDVSGMPELDALRILSELAQQRIISFR